MKSNYEKKLYPKLEKELAKVKLGDLVTLSLAKGGSWLEIPVQIPKETSIDPELFIHLEVFEAMLQAVGDVELVENISVHIMEMKFDNKQEKSGVNKYKHYQFGSNSCIGCKVDRPLKEKGNRCDVCVNYISTFYFK